MTAIAKTPLIGHLFECKWNDFWQSCIEYGNSLVWSTSPFWLGAIILFVQQQNDLTFVDVLTGTFRNGELFVFTIGTVTPITFMTLFDDPKNRFPHRLALGTLAVLLIVVCASFFALQKGKVPTKTAFIYHASLSLAVLAITLRYIASVYNRTKYPHTTEQDLIAPTEHYVDAFELATAETVQSSGVAASFADFNGAFNSALQDSPEQTSQSEDSES